MLKRRIPKINATLHNTPEDFIVAFYKKLGWNPNTHVLYPSKIKVCKNTWIAYSDILRENFGERARLVWMNCGPSSCENEYLRTNIVGIEKGAMKKFG